MYYSNKYNKIYFMSKEKEQKRTIVNKTIKFPGIKHKEDQGQKYTEFWII